MKLDFTCFLFLKLPQKWMLLQAQAQRSPQLEPKEVGRETASNHTEPRAKEVAKGSRKAAKVVQTFCRSSSLVVTMLVQMPMAADFVSIIRSGAAMRRLMVQSAIVDGICAAGKIATLPIQRRTTIQRRSDVFPASAS